MFRSLNTFEKIAICIKCGALVADIDAHRNMHHIKSPTYYDTLTTGDLIAQLKMLPPDAQIQLKMLGYDVEEVKLTVDVKNAPSIILLKA